MHIPWKCSLNTQQDLKDFEIKLGITYAIQLEIKTEKDTWKILKYLEIKSHISNSLIKEEIPGEIRDCFELNENTA